MADILYTLNNGNASCLLVSGLEGIKKGEKRQFHVENGAWSAYYCDGLVTYPVGDWRHRKKHPMTLYSNFTFTNDEDFQVSEQGYYNYTIYRFEKDILKIGTHI